MKTDVCHSGTHREKNRADTITYSIPGWSDWETQELIISWSCLLFWIVTRVSNVSLSHCFISVRTITGMGLSSHCPCLNHQVKGCKDCRVTQYNLFRKRRVFCSSIYRKHNIAFLFYFMSSTLPHSFLDVPYGYLFNSSNLLSQRMWNIHYLKFRWAPPSSVQIHPKHIIGLTLLFVHFHNVIWYRKHFNSSHEMYS